MKTIIFTLLSLLTCSQAYAQEMRNYPMKDSFSYYYKLNGNHLSLLNASREIADTSFYFSQLHLKTAKNFSEVKKDLGYGSFLSVNISGSKVEYNYISRSPLSFQFKQIDDTLLVYCVDTTTATLVDQASIMLNNFPLSYDSSYGAYKIALSFYNQLKPRFKVLFINYNNADYLYTVTLNKNTRSFGNDARQNNSTNVEAYGYFVTDKYKYKSGDTVRLMAYLLKGDKGNSLRRKLSVSLSDPIENKKIWTTQIKPHSPSSYAFEYVIPDTLKWDREYIFKIGFNSKGIWWNKALRIRLEEYQVPQTMMNASLLKDKHNYGDTIAIYAQTVDPNGFPLESVRLQYKMSIQKINAIYADSLSLHTKQLSNYLAVDTLLPFDKMHMLQIPTSVLPSADLDAKLELTLTDANYNSKVYSFDFNYCASRERLVFFQDKDQVRVNYLWCNKDSARNYTLKVYSYSGQMIDSVSILTPFIYIVKPQAQKILLIDENEVCKTLDLSYHVFDMVQLYSARNNNRLELRYNNMLNLPIFYHLYKNEKLIRKGNGRTLALQIDDDGKSSYRLHFTHFYKEKIGNNFYSLIFHSKEKQLEIKTNLPPRAFPGEQIPVEFNVNTYKGRPAKKINILSFANNALFDDYNLPAVHVPKKYTERIEIEKDDYLNNCAGENVITLKGIYDLNAQHLERYQLLNYLYYNLLFPKSGYASMALPKNYSKSELAVVVVMHASTYMPKYIKVDGELQSIGFINNKQHGFFVDSGLHDITIRCFDKEILIKQVHTSRFTKHLVSINLDSIDVLKRHPNITITDSLTLFTLGEDESKAVTGSILVLANTYFDSSLCVQNSSYYNREDPFRLYNALPEKYHDRDRYFLLGPFGDFAVFTIDDKLVCLKPGNSVYYYNRANKDVTEKRLPSGFDFDIADRPYPFDLALQYLEPDPTAALAVQNVYSMDEHRHEIPTPELRLEDFKYEPTFVDSGFSICVFNRRAIQNTIQGFWVINHTRPESSLFTNAYSPGRVQVLLNGSDPVDLVIFYKNRTCSILRDLKYAAGKLLYLNADSLCVQKIDEKDLAQPLKIYDYLNTEAFIPFYYKPHELEQINISATRSTGNQGPYLKINVLDESMSALEGVYAIFEQKGRFKYGAYSNQSGRMELLDLLPGTYDVKFYSPEHILKYYYQLRFESEKDYNLIVTLKEKGEAMPDYELVQNQFRYAGYLNSNKLDFKVFIYDLQSRRRIPTAAVELWSADKLIWQTISHSSSTQIPFIHTHATCKLYFKAKGYRDIVIDGIQFGQAFSHKLEVFMSAAISDQKTHPQQYSLEFDKGYAQNRFCDVSNLAGTGILDLEVTDQKNKPLEFCSIKLYDRNFSVLRAKTTNEFGRATLMYQDIALHFLVFSSPGYAKDTLAIFTDGSKQIKQTMQLKTRTKIDGAYCKAVIDRSSDLRHSKITADELSKLPTQDNKDAANTQSGVYQSKSGGAISLGGARSTNTVYRIDGVIVRDPSRVSFPPASIEATDIAVGGLSASMEIKDDFSFFKSLDMSASSAKPVFNEQVFEQMRLKKLNKQQRSTFRDVAYWNTNLITNKNGKAYANMQLPDNICSWNCFAIAAGKNFMYGQLQQLLKVYKPIQSLAISPSYLWEGDRIQLMAKCKNYLDSSHKISFSIAVDNVTYKHYDALLSRSLSDSLLFHVVQKEALNYQVTSAIDTLYQDAELLHIPIYSPQQIVYENRQFFLDKDSNYVLDLQSDSLVAFNFRNNYYELAQQFCDEIASYSYSCVEQTTSKLKAELTALELNRVLKKSVGNAKLITKLLKKLEDMQLADGSFSWWTNQQSDVKISIYVYDVLMRANQLGFSSKASANCERYLKNNLNQFNSVHLLHALDVLTKYQAYQISPSQLHVFLFSDLALNDKICFLHLLQQTDMTIDQGMLLTLYAELKGQRTANSYADFFDDLNLSFLRAYSIFENTSLEKEYIDLLQNKVLLANSLSNLNTYVKANLLDVLLKMQSKRDNLRLSAEIMVNDSIRIRNFPAQIKLHTNNLRIQHQGSPVWLNCVYPMILEADKIHDSVFNIQCNFVDAKQQELSKLTRGNAAKLEVAIRAFQSKKYCMIEVPIPSGLIIKNKKQPGDAGTYIEYRKDRILIFVQNLSSGSHRFSFDVEPVFAGQFVVPAAKVSLMYYPFVYGNSLQKSLTIE